MSSEKLRMIAAGIATKDEIVDRDLVVRDLCEAASEIDRLRDEVEGYRRNARRASKMVQQMQRPMSPEHAAAYHGDIDGDADPWIG